MPVGNGVGKMVPFRIAAGPFVVPAVIGGALPSQWRTQTTRSASLVVEALWRPAPGGRGADFHDVVDLDQRGVAVSVVDMPSGHGSIGDLSEHLIFTLRSGLRNGAGLAPTVQRLDRAVAEWPSRATGPGADGDGPSATFVVADPQGGTVRVVNAGRVPVLHMSARAGQVWTGTSGPSLGNPSARQEWAETPGPDDTILVFTDGLLKRRGRSLEAGIAVLEQTAPTVARSPEPGRELVSRLNAQLGQPTEHATLVSLRWRTSPPYGLSGPAAHDAAPATSSDVFLRVYVDRREPRSARTENIVRRFAAASGRPTPIRVQVLDISESTAEAEADGVIAAPSILRLAPRPTVHIVGGIRSARELASALELPYPEALGDD